MSSEFPVQSSAVRLLFSNLSRLNLYSEPAAMFDWRRGMVQTYEIILHWSDEDKVFVAEFPELPGCMAHGETQEKALENLNQAIELWIDTAKEFGDSIPSLREVD